MCMPFPNATPEPTPSQVNKRNSMVFLPLAFHNIPPLILPCQRSLTARARWLYDFHSCCSCRYLTPAVSASDNVAGGRHGELSVGVRLPARSSVDLNVHILVLDRGSGGEQNGNAPKGVGAGISSRRESDAILHVPVAQGGVVTDDFDRLSPLGAGALVEGDDHIAAAGRGRGSACRGGGRGDTGGLRGGEVGVGGGGVGTGDGYSGAVVGQSVSSTGVPRCRDLAGAAGGSGKECRVGPGQVRSGDGGAGVAVELLWHGAVRELAGINYVEKIVGVGLHGVDDAGIGRRGRREGASRDGQDEVLEEGKRQGRDGDRTLLLPYDDGVVELLGGGEGGEVPGVSVVVDVLGISANSDGTTLSNVPVDAVDGPERVDDGFVVRKSLVAARLEGVCVAANGRVKVVDGC